VPNNRGTCVRCGRQLSGPRPRNIDLERNLTDQAGTAAGLDPLSAESLSALADHRALPGGVLPGRDLVQEVREELADARNYLCWTIEENHAGYLSGDPLASERVAKAMDALSHVVAAWQALRP
jgi:hypothetical protein